MNDNDIIPNEELIRIFGDDGDQGERTNVLLINAIRYLDKEHFICLTESLMERCPEEW